MSFDKGNSITTDINRCLNRRYLGVACRHCISHCPADAIFPDQDHIDLDRNRCIGCGLCLSDCPTQVFRSDRWDETSIISRVKDRGWKVTEFFCAKHPSPHPETDSRNRGALQLPACLSIVSRGAWYELGLQTAVELHLEQCSGCPASNTIQRLEFNLGTASEWLDASGHSPQFRLIYSGRENNVHKNVKASETGFKITSRRDLFLSLIQRSGRAAGWTTDRKTPPPPDHCERPVDRYAPDWLQRLAKIYPSTAIDGFPAAYWPAIKIGDQCVHCGMCTLCCPSGALKSDTANGECRYTFTAGLCLDCGICRLACAEEAITRDKEPVARPFDTAIIYSSPVLECRHCGRITSHAAAGLCYWCSKETVIDRAFKEACQALLTESPSP